MMAPKTHRLDERQGEAKEAFGQANSEIWKKVQGDPAKIEQVKAIQDRARSLRLRMETHIYKHRQTWVSQEAVRILEEHGRQVLEYPRPSWVNRPFSATRQCWSKGIGGCDDFMKLRVLSSGCESRPARGEPARAGSEPCDGRGNAVGEA